MRGKRVPIARSMQGRLSNTVESTDDGEVGPIVRYRHVGPGAGSPVREPYEGQGGVSESHFTNKTEKAAKLRGGRNQTKDTAFGIFFFFKKMKM